MHQAFIIYKLFANSTLFNLLGDFILPKKKL